MDCDGTGVGAVIRLPEPRVASTGSESLEIVKITTSNTIIVAPEPSSSIRAVSDERRFPKSLRVNFWSNQEAASAPNDPASVSNEPASARLGGGADCGSAGRVSGGGAPGSPAGCTAAPSGTAGASISRPLDQSSPLSPKESSYLPAPRTDRAAADGRAPPQRHPRSQRLLPRARWRAAAAARGCGSAFWALTCLADGRGTAPQSRPIAGQPARLVPRFM